MKRWCGEFIQHVFELVLAVTSLDEGFMEHGDVFDNELVEPYARFFAVAPDKLGKLEFFLSTGSRISHGPDTPVHEIDLILYHDYLPWLRPALLTALFCDSRVRRASSTRKARCCNLPCCHPKSP